ncbi:transcriptional regulator [Oceanimonas sp. GK1]|uniref:TetR/AcrR family transcriptional regulator n=1 Tax=Oceanimonas sp. (strain GK1 / IBRC-M 10197) TaxID=511062 RepID=UPI0002494FB5|nr:TetR/AcrR family transcriptional regulator [Oceanimonas sp. GK1]AEY02194.1 transcriptional regulator [Oceanimonas sp. GK1]
MSWPSKHRAETRDRILYSAGRLFTEKGFSGASIDQVMEHAGLTRGAFYAHFNSKRELYAEALVFRARQMGEEHPSGVDGLIRSYLSSKHLSQDQGGCPLAFLVSDIGQQDPLVRESYTRIFKGLATKVAGSPHQSLDASTLRTMVMMVGGVAVAKALSDPGLSLAVLEACCEGALAEQDKSALPAGETAPVNEQQ